MAYLSKPEVERKRFRNRINLNREEVEKIAKRLVRLLPEAPCEKDQKRLRKAIVHLSRSIEAIRSAGEPLKPSGT